MFYEIEREKTEEMYRNDRRELGYEDSAIDYDRDEYQDETHYGTFHFGY